MLCNKELQQYPMRLIMWCTASEAAFYFAVFGGLNICKFHLNWFFAKSVFLGRDWNDPQVEYDSTRNLWLFNNFFINMTILTTIALNTSLCFDLIWLLKAPLSPKEPRETALIYGSLLYTLSVALTIFIADLLGLNFIVQIVGVTIMLLVAVFIGIAVASLIYAVQMLSKDGVSSETKDSVMRRHFANVFSFLILNLYIAFGLFITWNPFLTESDTIYFNGPFTDVLKYMAACGGLITPVIRATEPFFFRILFSKMKKYLCC